MLGFQTTSECKKKEDKHFGHNLFRSSFCMFTSKAGRIINIIACFAICILLRVPSALALTVHVFPDCENFFRSLAVSYKSWVKTSEYFKWYDFQLVSILQVLYPFVVLVILNSAIVIRLAAINRANKVKGLQLNT